jgi:ankyrin repeat protein
VTRVAFAAGEADEDSSLEEVLQLPDANGWPPLLVAAHRQQKGAVAALLQLGADVDCQDPQSGWTPLMYAVSVGAAAIARVLLHHGAAIDAFVMPHDWNALCVAIHSNRVDMVDLLLDAGADVHLLSKRHPCLAETYTSEFAQREARRIGTKHEYDSIATAEPLSVYVKDYSQYP